MVFPLSDIYPVGVFDSAYTAIYREAMLGAFPRLSQQISFDNGFSDPLETLDDIDQPASSGISFNPGDGYIEPVLSGGGSGSTQTYDNPDIGSTFSITGGYTRIDKDVLLPNNCNVTHIRVWDNTARAGMKIGIFVRYNSTSYRCICAQVVNHTGSGWEEFELTTPCFTSFHQQHFIGVHHSTAPSTGSNRARAYANGDFINVDSRTSFTEATSGGTWPVGFVHNGIYLPVDTSGGTKFADSTDGSSSPAYAFDGDLSTFWRHNGVAPGHIGVQLASAKVVTRYSLYCKYPNGPINFTFEGSNDGSSYTVLDTQTLSYGSTWNPQCALSFEATNATAYAYYRLNISNSGGNVPQVQEIRLYEDGTPYGRAVPRLTSNTSAYDAIPDMTSNTAPSGTASADSQYSASYAPWKAMDDDPSTYWHTQVSAFPHWIQYAFTAPVTAVGYAITNTSNTGDGIRGPKDYTLLGSNTGAFAGEEVTLDTQTNAGSATPGVKTAHTLASPDAYQYYRLHVTAGHYSSYLTLGEFELLTEDSGFAFDTGHNSTYAAWKALDYLDGTGGDYFYLSDSTPSSGSPEYVGYVFNEARTISGFYLVSGVSGNNINVPVTITIESSDDTTDGTDGTWTQRMSETADSWSDENLMQAWSFTAASAKGWRIKITDTTSGQALIGEMNFLEEMVPPARQQLIITTDAQEALTEPTAGYAYIFAKDMEGSMIFGQPTQGDNSIEVDVSKDDGATWEWVGPLTDEGELPGPISGIRQLVSDEHTYSASGDQTMRMRVRTNDLDSDGNYHYVRVYNISDLWNDGAA